MEIKNSNDNDGKVKFVCIRCGEIPPSEVDEEVVEYSDGNYDEYFYHSKCDMDVEKR